MTDYFYIALLGVAVVAATIFFSGTGQAIRERMEPAGYLVGGGLFLYGLVVSVADLVK